MNERQLVNYYNKFNEDKRLSRRHGIVEFETAIKYINMYLSNFKDAKILDVGAGTGRYSMYFSNLKYDVTAVELVKHNLRVLEKNCPSVKSYLGNAIDLSSFKSNSFDVVILFGPMYHLISFEDKVKALNEAKRVVKDNGYIFISYYINDYAIMKHGFIDKNIKSAFEKGNVNEEFHVVSKENDLGYSYEQLNGMISISTVEDTRILKISAVSTKPKEAKIIANALAEKAVTEIPKLMGTTAPNIAERAITPKFKSSPSLKKNTMLGALGGMVLVLAVLTFLFITDDTIKTEEDIEKYLEIIPLTVIPDGNVKYGAYSNYAKGKKYYTPKK